MRVLLHDNQICERGTTTSMLDYARALRGRGHEVELSYWSESPANVPTVIERVRTEFPLHGHKDPDLLPKSLTGFDSAYFIKAGHEDGLVVPDTHNLIHVVFSNYEPHGSRYAYVSEWLAGSVQHMVTSREGKKEGLPEVGSRAIALGCTNALAFEHLDHIVDIPNPQPGVREELGIPEEAFVIMRFGAYDSFDLPWVHETVKQALEDNADWFFLGLNTKPFVQHPRAIFIPLVPDNTEKASIVAAGDVFLTARGEGEAFGIAIAEALQIGVPVLAWEGGTYRNHVSMLKGLDATFRSPRDLRKRLKRLLRAPDPEETRKRKERGNLYRPHAIAPILETYLTPSP